MVNLEAQRLLDEVILDYLSRRGLHHIKDTFCREFFANQNFDVGNSSQEAFLQMWWNKFYDMYSFISPDLPILNAESFDKVAYIVENVVSNNVTDASHHTLSPQLMESTLVIESNNVTESNDPEYIKTMISELWSPEISPSLELDKSYQMPIVPPERNSRDNIPDINLEGPSNMHAPSNALPISLELSDADIFHHMFSPHLMASSPVMESNDPEYITAMISELLSPDISPSLELDKSSQMSTVSSERNLRDNIPNTNLEGPSNMNAPSNVLPTSPEFLDAGNNRSLQQMSTVSLEQNSRDNINLEGPSNMHAPSNALPISPELLDAGNNTSLQQASQQNMLPDDQVVKFYTNKLKLALTNQITAPSGRIFERYGKQPLVQSGKRRKTSLSSLALVEKDKAIIGDQSNSIFASTQRAYQRKGIFEAIHNIRATNIKLLCCHFNTQGEFLATAGFDKKVLIWELENNNFSSREGHTQPITDIRFRPNSTIFATSSLDKTVKIWDAAKPSKSYRNLKGHNGYVFSVDYHPTKKGLVSSCDHKNEIRLWDANRRDCKLILKGGTRQVRFEPRIGNLLASASENIINIFDIQTNNIQKTLQGHIQKVRSICWDMTGNYLASVSDDSARIWSINEGMCIFELFSGENKFHSCIFHPDHAQALLIGSNKLLHLWNPIFKSNITSSYSVHDDIFSSLAESPAKRIIASVSNDQLIKIWS